MALNDTKRNKLAAVAATKLPPDAHLLQFVVGRGPSPVPMAATVVFLIVAVVLLGVLVAVGGALGGGLGGLIFYSSYALLFPKRSVAVTDRGLAVMGHSFWSGKPDKVIEWLPPGTVGVPDTPGSGSVRIGSQHVKLPSAEFARLVQADPGRAMPPP